MSQKLDCTPHPISVGYSQYSANISLEMCVRFALFLFENLNSHRVLYLAEDIDEPVGFTARISEDLTYNAGDVIQFPYTGVGNFGSYFNTQTGIFVCPYDGIYMFYTNIRSDSTGVNSRMLRDSVILTNMYSPNPATRSNMAVTECLKGQKMWIENQVDDYDIVGGLTSTFSGFSLHRY